MSKSTKPDIEQTQPPVEEDPNQPRNRQIPNMHPNVGEFVERAAEEVARERAIYNRRVEEQKKQELLQKLLQLRAEYTHQQQQIQEGDMDMSIPMIEDEIKKLESRIARRNSKK